MSNPDTTRIFNYPEVTTPASDAKILLDSQTVGSKCIDANLFHCDLIDKTITQRGTFEASEDDADGFKKVVVDIPYTDVHVASGPIATFEGEDLPLKSLTASIVPVQSGSGTPSPSNVRPISGWSGANVSVCGVNQFDKNATFINAYCDYNTKIVSNNDMRSAIIPIKSGMSYKIIVDVLNQGMTRYGYTKDIPQIGDTLYNSNGVKGIEEYNDGDVITAPNGFNYLFITFYRYSVATDSFDDVKNAFGINYPSTDTEYHAYAGTTTTIPFVDGQGQSVTVYGGTLDVTSGVLTVDRAYVDLGTLNWALESGIFRLTSYVGAKVTTDTSAVANMICSVYKTVSQSDMGTASIDQCVASLNWGYGVRIKDTNYTDATAFRTAMNGVQLVYELATPITYQLTPTSIKSLDGVNNVFASTGDVDVEYQTVWVRPTE